MPDGSLEYNFVWCRSIQEIDKSAWDGLSQGIHTPFLSWAWLYVLEKSKSVSPTAGWQPSHLAVYRSGWLIGAAPLYIKDRSSEGEFVFDQPWAQLAEEMRVPYFPKLVGMSPLTPIGAYSFLLHPEEDRGRLIMHMQEEIDRMCRDKGIAGCHFNFLAPGWGRELEDSGFVPWVHPGFVWTNQEYTDFGHFLACFRSSRRKNIKREQKALADQGIRIEALYGDAIKERHLAWMHGFYAWTNGRYFPWSCKYLTQEFFLGLLDNEISQNLLLFAAYEQGTNDPVGMSMLVFEGNRLFGRYWGGRQGIPFLHFNLCYYQPIQWAIQNRIKWFDPGMGGEHKLYRGFELVANYSLHKVYAPGMQQIMDVYLDDFNRFQKQRIQEVNQELPLKNTYSDLSMSKHRAHGATT
jgi:hypothetical protein